MVVTQGVVSPAGFMGDGDSMAVAACEIKDEGVCCSLLTVSSGRATTARLWAGRAISSFSIMPVVDFSEADLSALRSTLASGVLGLMRLLESPSGWEA